MEKLIGNLLSAAIQAPSGDNLQPWAFTLEKGKIHIFLDSDKDRSFFNFKQCASLISCGALVENLFWAAKSLGIEPDFKGQIKKEKPLWTIGTFLYEGAKPFSNKEEPLKNSVLFKRCTNRKLYQKDPDQGALVSEIESWIQGSPVKVNIFQGETQKELVHLIYQADLIRVERKDLHLFLHETIRWSQSEIKRRQDGMPVDTLEAEKIGEIFLRATRPWPIMNFLNRLGVSKALARHTQKLALSASALVTLEIKNFDDQGFFEVGRIMERIWLKATEKSWAVQPLAAAPLFLFRWKTGDYFSFAPRHQKIMKNLEKGFQDLGVPHCAMILRIGRAKAPKVYAPRKPPEEFLLPKETLS